MASGVVSPGVGVSDVLGRDALAEVFGRVSFHERLATVPLVCKAWNAIAHDPACWKKVDMQPWFGKREEEDLWWEFESEPMMEFLVKRVVDLSCGQLTELRTTHCTDAAIEYLAERSPLLTVLAFPDSLLVTDGGAATLAAKCPKLEELDLSDCYNLSSASLEAFGRNCKALVRLSRNMLHRNNLHSRAGDEEEATAVARFLPSLRHLEMKKAGMIDVGTRLLEKRLAVGRRSWRSVNNLRSRRFQEVLSHSLLTYEDNHSSQVH